MKEILATLKRKWAEYILEILVIIIGILGAFMLNNWNESKKLETQRQKLISSLIEDFEYNASELKENEIPLSRDRLARMDAYFELLNSDQQRIEVDSLRDLAVTFFRFEHFQPSLSAYRASESTGSLALLDNKEFLRKINSFTEEYRISEMVKNQNGHAYYAGSAWEFRKTLIPGTIYNSRYSGTYPSNLTFEEYKALMTTPLALNAFHNLYVLEGNNLEQLSRMLEHSEAILDILSDMQE